MKSSRDKLIDATFQEIYKKGYSGTSLGDILENSQVKKGSLYHHFSSKKDLVLAMIKEKFLKRVEENWQELSQKDEGIIDTLILVLKGKDKNFSNGCPLGNVLQECSSLDEDFVVLMDEILKCWEKLFENALNKAIEKKEIKNIDAKAMALFLIAIYEGAILMSKRSKSSKEYQICINQLEQFLNLLKIRSKIDTKKI